MQNLLSKGQRSGCVTHFDGEWMTILGGQWPVNPPSIFLGVPNSCLNQVQKNKRTTTCTTEETRRKSQELTNGRREFQTFDSESKKSFVNNDADLMMFRIDIGRETLVFIHFCEVESPFGFLKFVSVEHIGMEVLKQILRVPRNSLLFTCRNL